MACGSKEFNPPFPFPPRGKPGGDGSPHAAACSAPAKTAGTSHAAAPPARGLRPLARSPWLASANVPPPAGRPGANMIAWKERMKDGRHVGLDFYDLLIEPIFVYIPANISSLMARCTPRGPSFFFRPKLVTLGAPTALFDQHRRPSGEGLAFGHSLCDKKSSASRRNQLTTWHPSGQRLAGVL